MSAPLAEILIGVFYEGNVHAFSKYILCNLHEIIYTVEEPNHQLTAIEKFVCVHRCMASN
jgi:hypothetical protein